MTDKALELLTASLRLRRALYGEDATSTDIARTLAAIAGVYRAKGDVELQLETERQAREMVARVMQMRS